MKIQGVKYMARYNEHKCLTCGQTFYYCRRCAITPIVYKAEGFCSEECSHIFNTLSKHGCGLITADDVITELSVYDIDKIILKENIIEHINKIKSETVKVEDKVIEEEPVMIVEEQVAVKQTNKKK
jgi:hypothetical protein